MNRRVLAALGVASLVAGCTSSTLPPPVAQTRVGAGHARAVKRVVALRATCGSLSAELDPTDEPRSAIIYSRAAGCEAANLDGVDALVRALLAFRGLDIVDSETLNATTRARLEVEHRTAVFRDGDLESSSWRRSTEVRGALFADAPPAIQDQILEEVGADAVLNVRILVGAGVGASHRRTVEALVRLFDFRAGKLVWASRCEVETGMTLNSGPIMRAARCAIEAARTL